MLHKMKQKKLLLTLLLLFIAVVITLVPRIDRDSGPYKVLRIADGDSFTLKRNNEELEIRLYGIDCPEQTQPLYRKAERFTSTMLQRGKIRLIEVDKDRYGRRVAWVYIDSLCLNEELVRHGLAWHYKHHSSDTSLARLEDSARTVKAGIWSDPHAVPPWKFRRKSKN